MIYDISRTLSPDLAPWPGDSGFSGDQIVKIADGETVNVSRLILSSHFGTHADAPYHFNDTGTPLDQVDLVPFWGKAQVISVNKIGELTPADFAHTDLTLAPRILLHSPASDSDPAVFPEEYIYPSIELADYFGKNGIILYGTDAPSVDHMTSKTLDTHHALLRNNIAIVEGLMLKDIPDGIYEFVALPLKIKNGDGSPVRAVLKKA